MTEARDTITAQKMMKEVLANRPEGREKYMRVAISFEVLGMKLLRIWE